MNCVAPDLTASSAYRWRGCRCDRCRSHHRQYHASRNRTGSQTTIVRVHGCNCWQKIDRLRAELAEERRLRVQAEKNASRFHAMLIAERVRRVA